MSPLDAASLFATLVGLICNWRSERANSSGDQFQAFLTWLTAHNFTEIRERIAGSDDIQRELHALLREDSALLSDKLDIVCQGVAAISAKVDTLGALSRAMDAPQGGLSDQAVAILKVFEQLGDRKLIYFSSRAGIGFSPSGKSITVGDARFIDDDLSALEGVGFIQFVDRNNSGDPMYAITRNGVSFAERQPQVTIGPKGE